MGTTQDQEDLDQREPLKSSMLSLLERVRMMSESTPSEELSLETTRPTTNPPRSKDSSLRRDLEGRLSTREPRRRDGLLPRRLPSLTRSSSLSTSRRRRPLTRVKRK